MDIGNEECTYLSYLSRKEKQELRGGTPLPPYSRPITYLFRVIDPTNYNYGYHSFVVNDDTMTCVVSGTGYRASAPCTPPQPIVSTISTSNFDHRTFDFFRIRMEKNITAGKILQKSVKNAKSRKIGTTRNSEKSGSVWNAENRMGNDRSTQLKYSSFYKTNLYRSMLLGSTK